MCQSSVRPAWVTGSSAWTQVPNSFGERISRQGNSIENSIGLGARITRSFFFATTRAAGTSSGARPSTSQNLD